MRHAASSALRLSAALAAALAACSPSKGPEVGSQTNWLLACDSSDACGELSCECNACTVACDVDADCDGLPGAACVAKSDEGTIALCGGQAPKAGLCLARCSQSCPEGTSCLAGICAPEAAPSARVTIDPSARHQTLVGFGASLSYAEDAIVARPDKAKLFDLAFGESGLDVIRVGNRYAAPDDAPLSAASEIMAAAEQRLGRKPPLFMTSPTPPVALKANASRTCAGDDETCTLVTLPSGAFDYPGFAGYWHDSLQAYADAGIAPDYVGIQNTPDWVPPAEARADACRFLPEEGTMTVSVGGAPLDVSYPGYREALAAVRAATTDLATTPQFIGPETGLGQAQTYLAALDAASIDGVGLHLYGQAENVDVAALEAVRGVAEQLDRPVYQTEMPSDGPQTALLVQRAMTSGGASAYVQNDLVSLVPAAADVALLLVDADGIEPQPPYYALAQFARYTDPGWVRVDADSDSSALLGSAWLSPDEDALSVVLVNPGDEDLQVEVALPSALRAQLGRSQVIRTVFGGVERAAELGELSADGAVRVPGGSIVTVALTAE